MNKYNIQELIGKGKFGSVYKGINKKTHNPVAIKIETESSFSVLKHETTILNYLYRKGCHTIPLIYWYGLYLYQPTLVMTYFEQVITAEQFSIVSFLRLLTILEKIHSLGVIHRDIKPANMMLKNGEIFLIDFGFANFFVNEHFEHKEHCIKEYIIGTPNYISIHIHNGNEASRRDDLISLGYSYLYLDSSIVNPLEVFSDSNITDETIYPEMHIKHPNLLEKRERKKWTKMESFLSSELKIFHYLKYCYDLQYNETPNYAKLREIFLTGTTA